MLFTADPYLELHNVCFTYMCECFVCLCVCVCCVFLVSQRDQMRASSDLGIGLIDDCEPPCRCQELNPGPLEEQLMLLTAEPFLSLLIN